MKVWAAICFSEQPPRINDQWHGRPDRGGLRAGVSDFCPQEGEGQNGGTPPSGVVCVCFGCAHLCAGPSWPEEEALLRLRGHNLLHLHVRLTVGHHGNFPFISINFFHVYMTI